MLETLARWDVALLNAINSGWACPSADWFFSFVTHQKNFLIPVLLLAGGLLWVSLSGAAYATGYSTPAKSASPGKGAPLPSGLVGLWAGEGNALDSAGANNGTLNNCAISTFSLFTGSFTLPCSSPR